MPNENDRGRHTPGPWSTAAGASGQVVAVFGSDGKYVSKVDAYPVRPLAENDANAHLLAAAPELLAACKAAIEGFRDTFEKMGGGAYQKAYEADKALRAAVSKAEGGAS